MSTELILIFLAISLVGLFLFWLFYRQSNSTGKLSEKYILQQLKNSNLSDEQRSTYEKQLSNILQQGNKQGSFKLLIVVAIFVIPFSLFFYNKLGNPAAVDYLANNNQKSTAQSTQGQAPQLSMQEAIKQLEQRLAQNPDDVDGQMLYARSQVSLKNYAKAVTAYRKSNELAPNETVILTELAEAIALANNNRSFLGEPEGLLAKAVELDPSNQKALWLLGMTFYEHQDFEKTNELWTKLYAMMSDEAAKKQLAQQLNDIRSKLGIAQISETQSTAKVIATNSELNININLSDKLKENLKGKRALLYVYTKEAQGMPMPIAVIRQPLEQIVKGFPIDLHMNDGNSLQPTRKLSDFQKIKIGARISFTGNAMPQTGDLQSDELLIDLPYADTVQLLIDSVR